MGESLDNLGLDVAVLAHLYAILHGNSMCGTLDSFWTVINYSFPVLRNVGCGFSCVIMVPINWHAFYVFVS